MSEMKEKILVIDDIEVIALAIKTLLSREGYDVYTACDYYDAMERFVKTDFDLVLTDIELGKGKTGIDVLTEVKKNNPGCRVIIHTGNTDYMAASDAKLMGAYDYLHKPANFEGLLHTINMALLHKTIPDDNDYTGVNR